MPQMAPISWLMLFLVFSITFMLFNILNYYIFIYSNPKMKLILINQMKSLNWKW